MTHKHRRPRITQQVIDAMSLALDHQAANIECDPGAFSKDEIDKMQRLIEYHLRLSLWFDDESRKTREDECSRKQKRHRAG